MKQHPINTLVACAVLPVIACNTDEKCREIQWAQDSYDLLTSAVARKDKEALALTAQWTLSLSADDYLRAVDSVRRRLWAQDAEMMRNQQFARAKTPLDSEYWSKPNPATDSLGPTIEPPPTPRQLAWYAEHCWEGKAR